MARAGAITLADCEPCKRRGHFAVSRLVAKHGNASLPHLRALLSADCPKQAQFSVYDQCKAMFEFPNGPPAPRGER